MNLLVGFKVPGGEPFYWAGFFDGEGSIIIYKNHARGRRNPSYELRATLAHTNIHMIRALHRFAGAGHITPRKYKNPLNKTAYYWNIEGQKAAAFIERMLPYLMLKRDQALLALSFNRSILRKPGQPTSEYELQKREAYRTQMRWLNQ